MKSGRPTAPKQCFRPVAPNEESHTLGLRIAEQYRLSIYAMIISAALGSGCTTLCSVDMQHGLVMMNNCWFKIHSTPTR